MPSMASPSEVRFWIKASPRGTRSGFTVLPDGAGGRVTVTVLPKPWSTHAGSVRTVAHRPGATTHVVVYETEVVAVETTSASAAGSLVASLSVVCHDQAGLLGLGSPPDRSTPISTSSSNPFTALIDLMLLAERGQLTTSPLRFEGTFAPSLLRLATHERLLKLVEGLLLRARPRYAEHTEILSMPRGRLRERSLLFSQATGTPAVESTFDELTMDTPVLQVVASALRVVASERLPRKIAALRPGLQVRAVHLLRYLSGVAPTDRDRALLLAERLWLGLLDRAWEPAIEAAIPVLRDRAVVPDDGGDSTEAVVVHVSTEKFWEQCLEVALTSVFGTVAVSRDGRSSEGVSVPAPWAPRTPAGAVPHEQVTEAFPDFMYRFAHRVVVADAKYKLAAGGPPSAQDGYQLFAYSHLATLDGRAPDVGAVLYPARRDQQIGQLEFARARDRTFPLWQVRLPFPTAADLHSQGRWSSYVTGLAETIRAFAAEWALPRDVSTDQKPQA